MPSFTRESGGTLHIAVMGVNRIGMERRYRKERQEQASPHAQPTRIGWCCGLRRHSTYLHCLLCSTLGAVRQPVYYVSRLGYAPVLAVGYQSRIGHRPRREPRSAIGMAAGGGHSQNPTTNRMSGERPDRAVGNVAGGGPPGGGVRRVEVGIFRLLFGVFRVSTRRFAGCPAGDVVFLLRWRAQVRCACWSALRHELRVPCFPSLHSRERKICCHRLPKQFYTE